MSALMEELIAEERAEERRRSSIATAKRMLKLGKYSYEEIAEITQLSLEEIETLANIMPIN